MSGAIATTETRRVLRTNWELGGNAVLLVAAVLLLAELGGKLIGTAPAKLRSLSQPWSSFSDTHPAAPTQQVLNSHRD